MKIKKPLLVEVEWVDIFATCGWEKLEEVVSPTFYTYGYMVYKDKNTIKVNKVESIINDILRGE